MTIHHDKISYGKIERTSEELSPNKLKDMLKELNEEFDSNEKKGDEGVIKAVLKENKK